MNETEINELLDTDDDYPYEKYYSRFNCEKNALDNLRRAIEFMVRAESVPENWKWHVLAVHSTLYGFAISTIRGSDSNRVLGKNGNLISFWEAIKRCQTENWTQPYGSPLTWNSKKQRALKVISKTLRNNFEHYRVISWSIEKALIVQNSLEYFKIIDELASNATPLSPMQMHGDIDLTRLLCRTAFTFLEGYLEILETQKKRDDEAAEVRKFLKEKQPNR